MTTALISMCRDEADITEAFIRHAASQVDFMVVADNNSVDGTRDILDRLAKELPLTVLDDPEIGFYQSVKMSELGEQAREMGADWIVPADFDEFWVSPHGRLGDILEQHTVDYGLVTAELYDYVATDLDDHCQSDPTKRLKWRRPYPLPLHKVAARAVPGLVIAMGNHWAHHPIPARFTESPALVVRHLPYRTADQFIRKARNGSEAYRATTGLDESVGAHWRQWGAFTDEQLVDVFTTYYWRDRPQESLMLDGVEQPALVFDPIACPSRS